MATSEQIEFRYRPGLISDLGSMALLMDRADAQRFDEPLPESQYSQATLGRIHERLTKPHAWSYVATFSGRMGGFVIGHPSSEEVTLPSDPAVEHIALLMIEPDVWRRRVGTTLLDLSSKHAKLIGKSGLVLWTGKANDRAQRFYEHYGYYQTNVTRTSQYSGRLVQYRLDV